MALKSEYHQTPNGGSNSVEPESHFDEDLEDGEIIEDDFDEPALKEEPPPVNRNFEKEQRKPDNKPINNYNNLPLQTKKPKNNFKKSHDNWHDNRPFNKEFNKEKLNKSFDNSRDDEFRFKKKRKKPRKEDDSSKPAKKPRNEKNPGNSESGEFDDDEDMLFVRGASPSGDHSSRNNTANSCNFDEAESEEEEYFPESSNNRGGGGGRGSFGNRRSRGGDRRSRPPMRGRAGKGGRGRGGGGGGGMMNRKGKHKEENQQDNICIFYLQGKCHRGDDCPYSHNCNLPKKMELCKFYLMDCCAKRDKCLYMHNDFPCKYYHTNQKCPAGSKNCQFSHGQLNDQLRSVLIKHIETAPKEILGDFARMGREGAIAFLKSGGVGNPALDCDEFRPLPDEQMSHTPVPSPSSAAMQDGDMSNYSNENYIDRFGSCNFSDDKFSNKNHSKNKKDKKWKNGKREERHHRKEDRKSDKERQKKDKSKGKERDKDRHREKDEKHRHSKHSPYHENDHYQNQMPGNPYEQPQDYQPYDHYSERFHEPMHNSQQKSNMVHYPNAPSLPQEDIPLPAEAARPIEKPEVKNENDSKDNTEKKDEKDVKDNVDKVSERDEILNSMPKKQRELFLRIQQHQRDAEPEADEPEPEEEPQVEENWYSSDEETEQKPSPLSAIFQTLNFQPSSTPPQNSNVPNLSPTDEAQSYDHQKSVPENQPPPLVIPSQFANINISDEVTKLLSTIRSQSEPKIEDPQKPQAIVEPQKSQAHPQPQSNLVSQSQPFPMQSQAPKVRDPRLRVDPGLTPSQPTFKKEVHTPINIPLKRQTADIDSSPVVSLMDIDLRLPNPELAEPQAAASSGGDVDLRHLPFKPAPIHQAATEIDASISSHPPILYRLIPIQVPKIDYSNIVSSTKGGLKDPRLCRDKPVAPPSSSEDISAVTASHHSQHPQHPGVPMQVGQPPGGGGVRDPRKLTDPRGPSADPRLLNADPRMDPRHRPGMMGAPQDPRSRMHPQNMPPMMGPPGTPMYDEDSRNNFNPGFNPMMPNPFSMDSDLRQIMSPMPGMPGQPGMRPFDGPGQESFPGSGGPPGMHDPRMRPDPRKTKEDVRPPFGFPGNPSFDGDVDLRMNQMPPRFNYSK